MPAENLLGEIGKGHKVAFNVLNFARFKLGAMCGGGAQGAIGESGEVRGASGSSSASRSPSFGAIKHKLGEMVVRTYAVESLLYRTAGLIDARIDGDAARCDRRLGRARGARGVRHRGVDREGGRQRGAQLRPRREHPDSRRQRLRARLPGRAPLSRRARQPHLRRHQRDQPAADPRHAGPAGGQRAICRSSPAAKALQDELLGPPSMPSSDDGAARRRAARGRGVQEDRADGVRPRACRPTARSWPTSRKC